MAVKVVLKVLRIMKFDSCTRGQLFCNGSYVCDTLEPTWRDYAKGEKKIKGQSAIPAGRYKFRVAMSPRWNQEVIWIDGVPNFTAIQIHIGNYPKDTEGCILVGFREFSYGKSLLKSRICFDYLIALIKGYGAMNGYIDVCDDMIV